MGLNWQRRRALERGKRIVREEIFKYRIIDGIPNYKILKARSPSWKVFENEIRKREPPIIQKEISQTQIENFKCRRNSRISNLSSNKAKKKKKKKKKEKEKERKK